MGDYIIKGKHFIINRGAYKKGKTFYNKWEPIK